MTDNANRYTIENGMGADGTEYAILDNVAQVYLPDRFATYAEAFAAIPTETTYDANTLDSKSQQARLFRVRDHLERPPSGRTYAVFTDYLDGQITAINAGGVDVLALLNVAEEAPSAAPEPVSLEDQFRALLKAGLANGTVRAIMAEADQENYPAHIEAAREQYASDELEIDAAPEVSPGGDPGVWVAAWVWVSDDDAGVSHDDEEPDEDNGEHELTCASHDGGRCDCGAAL